MNCIVICCDTFRWDCLDTPAVRTPALDRLAARGAVFKNAYAEGLPTIQARRSLYSGCRSYPWRFEMDSRGVWPVIPGWHRIPPQQQTMAETLLDAGVITGLVADTYHMFKPTHNFTRGFCSWEFIRGQESDNYRSGPRDGIDVSPYMPSGKNDIAGAGHLVQYLMNMQDRKREEDYLTARVFRTAARWLDDNAANTPFFLWIDSFAPHEFWDPPREYADAYYKAKKSRDYIVPQWINPINPDADTIDRTRALYHGYVTFVDQWIGHLLDRLDGLGLTEDTTVVFTSDHGTELWDKGRFGKGGDRLYDYIAKIPLIIAHPEENQGTRPDVFIQHQDLMPTLFGLLGVSPPAGIDGRNVWDVLAKKAPDADAVITAWDSFAAIRSKEWTCIFNPEKADGGEKRLFHRLDDPDEEKNLAAANEDISETHINQFKEILGVTLPVPVSHRGDDRQVPPMLVSDRARRIPS